MDKLYLDNVKKAAYFLWEYTGYDDALKLWYCAEDIACYLEEYGFIDVDRVESVLNKDRYDEAYIQFVRHIAFRIYVYTNNRDDLCNWFIAEKLISNHEWLHSALWVANYYGTTKMNTGFVTNLRSDKVKSYYSPNKFFL